jgi:hypothetical protein
MQLDDVAAELLAQPLEQFTPKRNARAKELKAAGQAALAAEVAALRKPSVALWAANQVAREKPAILRKLRQSADALAKAQTTGRADAARSLRAASDEFQGNLDAVAAAATEVLRRNDHPATEETLRRIREVLRLAALQGGDTWTRLEKGALISEPEPGDDVMSMFQASAAATGPAPKPSKADERAEARRAHEAAERQAKEDAERAEQAEATARRMRAEAREAAAAAERAEQRATAAEEEASRAKAAAQKSKRALARRAD